MSFHPDEAVREAESDIGWTEGDNNSNPYSDWQYGNRFNPYCNSAVCYWAWVAGFRFWANCTYGEKGEAYTPTYAVKAREHGVWRDKWWKAKPGDDVEFDWGNNGLIDHVEKVVADDGTTIITVGANTSNGVYYRRRDRSYVSNFVALSEAGQIAVAPKPPPFKVRPMFEPSLPLRAILHHPQNKGTWLGFSGGRVIFVYSNLHSPQHATGGMISDKDRRDFKGRTLARLELRPFINASGDKEYGYTIIATSKEEYVPENAPK